MQFSVQVKSQQKSQASLPAAGCVGGSGGGGHGDAPLQRSGVLTCSRTSSTQCRKRTGPWLLRGQLFEPCMRLNCNVGT